MLPNIDITSEINYNYILLSCSKKQNTFTVLSNAPESIQRCSLASSGLLKYPNPLPISSGPPGWGKSPAAAFGTAVLQQRYKKTVATANIFLVRDLWQINSSVSREVQNTNCAINNPTFNIYSNQNGYGLIIYIILTK